MGLKKEINHERTIKGAGHFLQEAKGPALAGVIVQFIQDNPL